jgi:hypothetical protein
MNQAPTPPLTGAAGDSSARITKEPSTAAFVAPEEDKLAEELARLAAVKEEDLKAIERKAPNAASPLTPRTNSEVFTGKQTAQKALPVTGKQVAQPRARSKVKPLSVGDYVWRPDGSGWELRKVITEDGQRKQRYISHLGKAEYQEIKRQHKGQALADALAVWVREREREKGAQTI